MKIFIVSWFVFVRLALSSAWIVYEKSSPPLSGSILLRKHAPNLAPLNLPERRNLRNERMARPVPQNETPRSCVHKGTCDQLYYRGRSKFKKIFEATPTFRRNYGSLYPRKMKGRQATQQPMERYYSGSSFIYMTPNLMIVRPGVSKVVPNKRPVHSGLREGLFTKAEEAQQLKPERPINKDYGFLQEFPEKPKTSKEETPTTPENRTTFTDLSLQAAKTNSTSQIGFHEVQPNLVQPYAVREIVDESDPIGGDGRKPLFTPNIREETNAEVPETNHNSRILKIIPLSERDKTTEKNVENATAGRYPTTTDHFLRIIPSQHSQSFIQNPIERMVNRKDQSKNLKIGDNPQENYLGATADNNPISNSGVKNRENHRAITITPSNAVNTPRQDVAGEINHISVANLDEINRNVSESPLTEVAAAKTESIPEEVTFKVLDVESGTNVPEDATINWKPIGKVLDNIEQNSSGNFTKPEGFMDRPIAELPKPKPEVKDRESLSKNSRKMHFGRDPRPNQLLGAADQRRSDILISDTFEDYVDDENNLSYLEKLKRNNSLDALKNQTSASLIPLIPIVIQDLRQGKIPPEDIYLLSSAFGDLWPTVLELSNSTNIDMLPILKMKDENDLKNVLQSIQSNSIEPATTTEAVSVDYDSYDYMEKFKDLYEDLLNVGQELEVDEEKKLEKR